MPGHQINTDNVTSAFSVTYDGLTYGKEYWTLYGEKSDYSTRCINRMLGYVRDFIGFKIRTVSVERVAFSGVEVEHG